MTEQQKLTRSQKKLQRESKINDYEKLIMDELYKIIKDYEKALLNEGASDVVVQGVSSLINSYIRKLKEVYPLDLPFIKAACFEVTRKTSIADKEWKGVG